MRSRRWTTILAAAAALACALGIAAPLYSGRTWDSYAQERRAIRAAILMYGDYTSVPSPYVFYLLGSNSLTIPLGAQSFEFHPPRPPGWDIVNPVAATQDQRDPAYWAIAMDVIDLPLLQNFDVLLVPIAYTGALVGLTPAQQQALETWVEQGGLLWMDNQPGAAGPPPQDPLLGDFFLRPPLQFAGRDRTVTATKTAVDPNHPLLRGRCVLTDDELQWLGEQYPYAAGARVPAADPTGAPLATSRGLSPLDGIVAGVNCLFPPNNAIASITALQEVVGEVYDVGGTRYRTPAIAAGHFGEGCIVISACGVGAGISNWYAGLTDPPVQPQTALELPQWALPDLKLAYNMIQWWMDWSGAHGRVRFRGDYVEALPGPPLPAWSDATTLSGSLGGPACVSRGLTFAGSASGVLGVWDSNPYRDRDLDGRSDDGAADYANGFAADRLWSLTVPWQDPADPSSRSSEPARQVVGTPAVATTYDGTRPRRLAAAAVKTTDNLDCSLQAYLADATDGEQVAPVWSATIKHHSLPQPSDNHGLVGSGPVAADQFFALLTTDSGTLEAPNRDAGLLLYDAAGWNTQRNVGGILYEEPAAQVPMTAGGRAMSFANSPAVTTAAAYDALWQPTEPQPVQVAVATGDSLPRPLPSAVGWLYVTPLMVRAPAPGWDQVWVADIDGSGVVEDVADDQAVQVWFPNAYGNPGGPWIQVPPHVDNDPSKPLNYVRNESGGQLSITFTRWAMFGWGPAAENRYPLGFGDIWIRYRDAQDNWRELRPLSLSPGSPTALNGMLSGAGNRTASVSGFINEAGYSSPCVVEDTVFIGTDAVDAYPSPSSEGQLASCAISASGAGQPNWRFIGDRYRGETPLAAGGYYYSSFSFTPACFGDTLYAVANYRFFRRQGDQRNEALSPGPSGALYALELNPSAALVNPGTADPVFRDGLGQPIAIDPTAPPNDGVNLPPYSADPNQVVAADRSGATVWISTNTDPASSDYNSPRYAIPQISASQSNWRVEFQDSIIRLDAGAIGDLGCPVWNGSRYLPQRVRVRFFSSGVLTERTMEATPLVKWMYLAPDGWEFVSSPVVANDTVMAAAYDHGTQRYLLLGLPVVPEDPTPDDLTDRPWSYLAQPAFVSTLASGVASPAPCSLAVADRGLVWASDAGGLGGVAGLASPELVIADSNRLLMADAGGRAVTSENALWHLRPGTQIGAAGIPVQDSYAERMFEPLERPTRARALPNGNLLVVDTGASMVVELDPAHEVVWRYPNDDPAADLGGMTAEQAWLLAPADAQRYYYRTSALLADVVDLEGVIRNGDTVALEWVTTLIADAGKYRVLEVARPLVNGRYRPDLTNAALAPLFVELVREVASPPLTDWPTRAGGATKLEAAFTTVARLEAAAPYPYLSTRIMCAVGNHPPDPRGDDQYVRLVEIAPAEADTGQPLAYLAGNRVVGRGAEGINIYRPRTSPWSYVGGEQLPRDFLSIRQADSLAVNGALHALVVDDVGVKLVDYATWNNPAAAGYLTPVFEMRGAAPWMHDTAVPRPGGWLTTYEEEIAELEWSLRQWTAEVGDPVTTGRYPPLISEPHAGLSQALWDAARVAALNHLTTYAQATVTAGSATGAVGFLPAYAKRLGDGQYLVVNSYPNPYSSTDPLELAAPTTGEVLLVNPALSVGQRVVRTLDPLSGMMDRNAWDHLLIPDPGRSEYPSLRGGARPLRQPRAVDLR
ncbi:MAG TPA: hypothetical protein VM221_10395 [Armatimonadota bacterium]|nr:hypothetical protein [Armatimonadota bacterium]